MGGLNLNGKDRPIQDYRGEDGIYDGALRV